jgi:hypothetical protein
MLSWICALHHSTTAKEQCPSSSAVARHFTPEHDVAARRPPSCEIAPCHDSDDHGLELGTEYQYI